MMAINEESISVPESIAIYLQVLISVLIEI